MKNSIKMIAAVVAMAAMVLSCAKTPLEVDTKPEVGDNTSAYGYVPGKTPEQPKPQTDSLISTNHYGWEWIELVVNYEYKSTNTWKTAGEKDLYGSSMTRPIEVKGGAKVEKEVSSEAELDGVKYTEGQVVETASRWNANDWYGEQSVRALASKLSNGKYGADFELTYSSSDAHFVKDSLAKDFPDVAWSRKAELDSASRQIAADNGGYYKVKDYIATHNLVAEVENDFVKDGKPANKNFVVRDTLSLKFFVKPDPKDKFMRRWMVVELSGENQTIEATFVTREEWSLSGIIEVDRKPFVRKSNAQGQNYPYVQSSTDDYETTGTKVEGTGNMTFIASGSNGHEGEGLESAFSMYADGSITYSYKDCSETVICKLVCDGVQQNITAKGLQTINGVYYNVSDYVASIAPVYTATWKNETASINLSATSSREIWVKVKQETKVESKDYSFTANVNGNTLVGTGLNTVKKAEYVNDVKKDGSEQTFTQEKIITATLTVTPTFTVADKAGLNAKFTWGSFGETANEPEQTVTENNKTYKVNVRNFRGYVAGKPAYVRLEEKTQVVTIDGVTLASTEVVAVKAVDLVASAVAGNNVTLTPEVEVTLSTDDGVATKAAIGEAKTYTIEGNMVGTYTPETVRTHEPKVENGQAVVYVYDVTGDVKVQVRRDPFTPAYFLTAQAGTDVIAANNLFATVYNGERNGSTSSSSNSYWTVSNKKGQITSTMSNGAKSETNVADFGFDQTITYKDGDYTYTFNGSMVFSNSTDAITAAGNKTVNGIAYEASNYQENFYGVYSIDGTVIANLSDAVKRQILVEVEIEDIVPGTILSVDVRAVAAAWNGSKYINKDGHLDKIKGLAVVTKEHKGAYIPFAGANDNVALPSDDAIKNANYVERSYYDANYVAGYDTDKSGNWQLATVDDKSNQVLYKDNGTAVRSLTEKSMNTWGWSKSEQNSKVSGYKIEVKDGICTIYFNNKLVKRFK